jgi:hypothetical protein
MKEMQELAAKEPKSHKLHQWLSKEGRDALQAHFLRLLALMQASTSWEQMMSMVDNVLPTQGATLMLPFMATADPLPSDSNEP